MKAIRAHRFGDPKVMVLEDVPDPKRAWVRKLSEQRLARSEYYEMGALIQLLDWCTEELKRRNAGDFRSPPTRPGEHR